MDVLGKLLSASIYDIKNGYIEEPEHFQCLLCGERTEKGFIYPHEDLYFDARRQMKNHISTAHGSVFDYLIGLDKKFTGLSEHQTALINLFYHGNSDAEIQRQLGIGSSSTIRNHRFILKEKERQAKIFLVLMELLKTVEKGPENPSVLSKVKSSREPGPGNLNEDEMLLKKYFPDGFDGPLKTFQVKEKSKLIILKHIVKRFESERIYSEKEVNQILSSIYDDYVTLRRYLIEYGFMERKPDGSQYWIKSQIELEESSMNRRKELQQQYREVKKEAGVYQIRNTRNNKILVLSTPDLKTMNGKRFELNTGGYKNALLQKEWKESGEDAFQLEVLEVLKEKEDGFFNLKDELKKLEEKWLNKLQPYGEKGYNKGGLNE